MAPLPLFPDLPDPEPTVGPGGGLRGCLAELVEEGLPEDEVLRIHQTYRGRDLYVPRPVPDTHHLAVELGPELAARLSLTFGNQRITIPKCPYSRAGLYARLRAAVDARLPMGEICRRYDVHERTVWEACGR